MTQKVAIITAAGSGMGAASARELAARGYQLALLSPSGNAEKLAGELGGIGMKGSVTEMADLETLVLQTMEHFGRIDAVVNSTGHPTTGDLLDIPDDGWVDGMNLVLMNVIRMAKLVTPVMLSQGGGAFVNISAFSAFEPSASFPVSSTFRAALASFTKLYANRYAADHIRMNNVLPGFIDSYEVDDATLKTIPMGRSGTVAEIAKTVAFLLSDDAGYITGPNLRVDGGITRSV